MKLFCEFPKAVLWVALVLAGIMSSTVAGEDQEADNYPTAAAKFRDLGFGHYKADRYREAIAAFNRALSLAPDAIVHYARAATWHELKEHRRAIKDCTRAIEMEEELALAYLTRSLCAFEIKDMNRAIADSTHLIDVDNTNEQAFFVRGVVWGKLDQHELALADFDEAILRDAEFADAYKARAVCLIALGDMRRATTDLGQALRLKPNSAEIHVMRGHAIEQLGDHAAARRDYQRAIDLDGDNHAAMNALAMSLVVCPDPELRDYKKGIYLAYRICEDTRWREWEYICALATAHAQSGDFAKAIRLQSDALRMAPAADKENVESWLKLYQSGQSPDAAKRNAQRPKSTPR